MTPRIRSVLTLILGLAAAASVFAQGRPTRAAAVVKDMKGALTVQIGSNAPQAFKPGMVIPVGAIVQTGTGSGATLVFPDGQVCTLGGNSWLRVSNYAYNPKTPSANEMALTLNGGSIRCVLGAIADLNPAGVRVQVGLATVGVSPASASRADTSAVVEHGTMAMTVDRGSVVVFLPSGQPQPVGAGQGLFFGPDGTVVNGTTSQIMLQIGTLPQGKEMQQQFAALVGASQNMELTILMLSNPLTAQELLAPFENLPPGEVPELAVPPLTPGGTPPTSAGGGGPPCSASCN